MNNTLLKNLFFTNLIFLLGLFPQKHQAHKHHAKPNLSDAKHTASNEEIVSGGYRYISHYLTLPADIDIQHTHDLTRDNEDNIYLAYTSNTIDKNTRAIVMFNNEGKFVRYIGNNSLTLGEPYGLDLTYENDKK